MNFSQTSRLLISLPFAFALIVSSPALAANEKEQKQSSSWLSPNTIVKTAATILSVATGWHFLKKKLWPDPAPNHGNGGGGGGNGHDGQPPGGNDGFVISNLPKPSTATNDNWLSHHYAKVLSQMSGDFFRIPGIASLVSQYASSGIVGHPAPDAFWLGQNRNLLQLLSPAQVRDAQSNLNLAVDLRLIEMDTGSETVHVDMQLAASRNELLHTTAVSDRHVYVNADSFIREIAIEAPHRSITIAASRLRSGYSTLTSSQNFLFHIGTQNRYLASLQIYHSPSSRAVFAMEFEAAIIQILPVDEEHFYVLTEQNIHEYRLRDSHWQRTQTTSLTGDASFGSILAVDNEYFYLTTFLSGPPTLRIIPRRDGNLRKAIPLTGHARSLFAWSHFVIAIIDDGVHRALIAFDAKNNFDIVTVRPLGPAVLATLDAQRGVLSILTGKDPSRLEQYDLSVILSRRPSPCRERLQRDDDEQKHDAEPTRASDPSPLVELWDGLISGNMWPSRALMLVRNSGTDSMSPQLLARLSQFCREQRELEGTLLMSDSAIQALKEDLALLEQAVERRKKIAKEKKDISEEKAPS